MSAQSRKWRKKYFTVAAKVGVLMRERPDSELKLWDFQQSDVMLVA